MEGITFFPIAYLHNLLVAGFLPIISDFDLHIYFCLCGLSVIILGVLRENPPHDYYSANVLSQVLSRVKDFVIITDAEGKILDINESAINILKYDLLSINDKNITDLLPDFKTLDFKDNSKANVRQIKINLIAKDSLPIPVLCKICNVSKNGNDPGIYFFIMQDLSEKFVIEKLEKTLEYRTSQLTTQYSNLSKEISDRKKIEDALQLSEEKFKELFDEAPVGYHEIDSEGRIVRINKTELDMLGYSAEEMVGYYVWEFIGNKELSHQAVNAKLSGAKIPEKSYERTFRRKDGLLITVLVEDKILKDSSGSIIGIRTNFQDISERVKAEDALRKNETKFRKIFENIQDVFYQTDITGKILEISPSVERYTGYKTEYLIGRRVYEVYNNSNDRIQILKRLAEKEEIVDYELQIKDINNNAIWTSVNIHYLYDEEGNKIGFEGSLREISERKRIEEAEKKLLEQLHESKRQLEWETKKLFQLNSQLEESEEKLTELNASKDKLFSIIAHDLKNPFHTINSISEVLKNDFNNLSDDEKLQLIKSVEETSNKSYKLLENLLSWAQSQTGKFKFSPEPQQLKKLVKNVFQLFKSQAANKHIALINDVSPAIIVYTDPNMIDTIIRNLTSNAIKFTDSNGTIKINSQKTKDCVQISVTDTGIGMTESDIEKLFRVGVKNSEIGNSKEKGTGLGLILCKEFVEKHGGVISVESKIGNGSKFTCTIPSNLR